MSPASTVVGTGSFTLTVNGVNFVSASQVRVNGAGRITTFVNSGQLTAAIQSGDVVSVRTLQITVANPGGLLSSAVPFDVLPNSPQITSIDPSTVTAGSGAFALRVIGQNFASTSVVNLNGSPRTTTYI
ncbi:MAG TPA: IPT/TIG domain-containing protein, partial [Thermoanaerobaculia bacterium]